MAYLDKLVLALKVCFGILLISLCLCSYAQEKEENKKTRVINFLSYIKINTDGSMDITNEVDFYVYGDKFEVKSVFSIGDAYKYTFLDMQLDGKPSTESIDFAREKIIFSNLVPGKHKYIQKYKVTSSIVDTFKEYDQFAWRAIYFDRLEVEGGRVTIELPEQAEIINSFVTVRDSLFYIGNPTDNTRIFTLATLLAPSNGFNVTLNWKKGVIKPSEKVEVVPIFWAEDFTWMVILFVFAYYLYIWFQADNVRIYKYDSYPISQPPKDFTYPSIAVLTGRDNWHHLFPISILSLAMKGYIKIKIKSSPAYTFQFSLIKKPNNNDLPYSEYGIMDTLFKGKSKNFTICRENSSTLQSLLKFLQKEANKDFNDSCLSINYKYFMVGLIISMFGFLMVAVLPNKFLSTDILFPSELLCMNALAYIFLKKDLIKLGKVEQRIEGFASYLKGDVVYIRGKLPTVDKQLYEEYLPFALLLNACEPWTNKFINSNKNIEFLYDPTWFKGDLFLRFKEDTYVDLINQINIAVENSLEDN